MFCQYIPLNGEMNMSKFWSDTFDPCEIYFTWCLFQVNTLDVGSILWPKICTEFIWNDIWIIPTKVINFRVLSFGQVQLDLWSKDVSWTTNFVYNYQKVIKVIAVDKTNFFCWAKLVDSVTRLQLPADLVIPVNQLSRNLSPL